MGEYEKNKFEKYLDIVELKDTESFCSQKTPDKIFLSIEIGGASVSFAIPLDESIHDMFSELDDGLTYCGFGGSISQLDIEVEFLCKLREKLKYNKDIPATNMLLVAWMDKYHDMIRKVCECGAEKINTTHTDWCPKS